MAVATIAMQIADRSTFDVKPPPAGSDGMQDFIRFKEPKSHARVDPHPIDIKLVPFHAVDTGEGRVEFLAAIVFHARPVALHEAVSPRHPRAMDVDHVVPFSRTDLR